MKILKIEKQKEKSRKLELMEKEKRKIRLRKLKLIKKILKFI